MPNSWPGEFISEAVISIVASVKSGGVRGPGSTGPCRVLACDRIAHLPGTLLCKAHGNRWRTFRRANPGMELGEWCRREKQVTDGGRVLFAGVHHHVRRQVLYGVYNRSRRNSRTRLDYLQRIVDWLRWLQTTDLLAVRDAELPDPWPRPCDQILKTILVTVEYGDRSPKTSAMPTSGPASSSARPVSPISGTSHKAGCETSHKHGVGTTSTAPTAFTCSATSSTRSITSRTIYALTPPPLAETTSPPWTARPSSRSPHTLPPSLNRAPNDTGRATATHSRGTDPCNKMPTGSATHSALRARNEPHGSIRGIVHGHRRPAHPRIKIPSKMMPAPPCPSRSSDSYLRRGVDGSTSRAQRAHAGRFVRLAAETGRRPGELVSLKYDCIDTESEGGPFLIYTETKVTAGQERKLPVLSAVVDTVREQQLRTRQRHADTPIEHLRLFPRSTMNPHGYHPMGSSLFGDALRKWINELPSLDSDAIGDDGQPLPFDRTLVSGYSFRHTYAQRHADAGIAPDVLMAPEPRRSRPPWRTTGSPRRREAAEIVGNLVIDGEHLAIRPMAGKHRLADERSTIAVPFGKCSNPQNVAAEGHGCPIRHQCFGCASFSSDPSYLPEMRRRLLDLKAIRARVDAFDGAAEWAKRDARPSDEEIEAIQQRIRTEEDKLAHATPEQRALIDNASITLRKVARHYAGRPHSAAPRER